MKKIRELSPTKIAVADFDLVGPDVEDISDYDQVSAIPAYLKIKIFESHYDECALELDAMEANKLANFIMSLGKPMVLSGKEYKEEVENDLPF